MMNMRYIMQCSSGKSTPLAAISSETCQTCHFLQTALGENIFFWDEAGSTMIKAIPLHFQFTCIFLPHYRVDRKQVFVWILICFLKTMERNVLVMLVMRLCLLWRYWRYSISQFSMQEVWSQWPRHAESQYPSVLKNIMWQWNWPLTNWT